MHRLLFEHTWPSHPFHVQYAREAARSAWQRYTEEAVDLIELAIGEACANAVEHGSPRGEQSAFIFRCYLTQDSAGLTFEVQDEGPEFAVDGLPFSHTPDLYSEGGRGLFLIHQIMDQVEIRPGERGLTLRMTKRFHADLDFVTESHAAYACTPA